MPSTIPWLEIVTGLLGLLSSIALGIAGYALVGLINLKVKIAELWATVNAQEASRKEALLIYQREVDRRFDERKVERNREYELVFAELKKIDGAVTRVHERLDKFVSDKIKEK